jgi:hypothetical protein
MKTGLLKIGFTTLGIGLATIIAGVSMVVIALSFKIAKWVFCKLFGITF